MKKFLVLALLFMDFASFADDKQQQTVRIKTSAICSMCKRTIERQLAYTKGIKEANLDLKDKVVTVTFFPKKTTLEKIKASIAKSGYDADDVQATQKGYNNLPDCCKKENASHEN